MPSLSEVYCRFGYASEAAQLLETELGNVLLKHRIVEEGLIAQPDAGRGAEILSSVNRNTLGQLLKAVGQSTCSLDHLESLLTRARNERNRLAHTFFRQHNFRRNSDEGRAEMVRDLEDIHGVLLEAYKAVLAVGGFDLDSATMDDLPTTHLPL